MILMPIKRTLNDRFLYSPPFFYLLCCDHPSQKASRNGFNEYPRATPRGFEVSPKLEDLQISQWSFNEIG
jgi:hypothetical protein